MKHKRIVITGVGVVSPLGIGKNKFWQALRSGTSGIRPVTLFNSDDYNVKVAGEITEFDSSRHFSKRELIDLNRASALLLVSSKLAILDSQIEINDENADAIGVSAGTTFGSLHSYVEFDKESLLNGPQLVNPALFPNVVTNLPASLVSIHFKIKGFNTTVSTGMCAALDAIDHAVKAIRLHNRQIVVTGAVEDLCEETFAGFYRLSALSGCQKNSAALSCPFDKRRNGMVFGEGAGSLIIEDLDSATKRGANIYAEVLSVASTFEPSRFHGIDPGGKGMVQSMKMALQKADIGAQDIDYICANANSTREADVVEANAIKKVFGRECQRIRVSSIKSMVGESYSAAGSLATIACIGAMQHHFIPPNINAESIDDAVDLNLVINKAAEDNIKTVMINSFGQHGANSCLIIRKHSLNL